MSKTDMLSSGGLCSGIKTTAQRAIIVATLTVYLARMVTEELATAFGYIRIRFKSEIEDAIHGWNGEGLND